MINEQLATSMKVKKQKTKNKINLWMNGIFQLWMKNFHVDEKNV
jgi:hypothetical protein